jgi:hypothetical protein
MRNWCLECGAFVALGIFESCNFLRKDPLPWDITHHLRGAFRTWARTHTLTEQRGCEYMILLSTVQCDLRPCVC